MKLRSEVVGGVVTAIYLVGIAFLVYLKRDSLQALELNGIGDFLAGVFGPIAFLWLVLGYIQQGRELKLSSEALRMQAEELKSSVEQQTIMAVAATDQLKAQQAAFELQVWRHEQEISPDFDIQAYITNTFIAEGKMTSCIRVLNRGHDVRFVVLSFDSALGSSKPLSCGDMKTGIVEEFLDFEHIRPEQMFVGRCYVEYLRADNKNIKIEFSYKIYANGGMLITKTAPTALSQPIA